MCTGKKSVEDRKKIHRGNTSAGFKAYYLVNRSKERRRHNDREPCM